MADMYGNGSPYGFTNNQQGSDTLAQLRLDTEHSLKRIELYLRGKDVQLTENDAGELIERVVVIGEPKMNDRGIQAVMHKLNSIFNSHIVQGNLTAERHSDIVFFFYADLAEDLMANLVRWGVDINDYSDLIDTIIPQVDIFLSRTIDNKEREALVPTMQHIERTDARPPESNGVLNSVKNAFSGGR